MKTLRYLRMSPVSIMFILVALGLFIWYIVTGVNTSPFLVIVMAYAFRATMWQGQYVDEIERLRDLNDQLYSENAILRQRNMN